MGAPAKRCHLLPAGVDLDRYLYSDGQKVRNQLHFATSDLVLFFMGWMYPFSGLREIAEAILDGGPSTANLKLLVVGRGPLRDDLEALRKARGNGERIVVLDWKPYAEIPEYLAASDICLLASRQEDVMQDIVPIKMYEYMAAGKPVIATRLHGLVREFGEGHGVVYVNGPDEVVPKALELANTGILFALGQEARAFVGGRDWRTITDHFETALSRLSGGDKWAG